MFSSLPAACSVWYVPFHVLSCISLILLDLGTLGPGINETRQAIDKLHVVSLLSGCVDISMKADYFVYDNC